MNSASSASSASMLGSGIGGNQVEQSENEKIAALISQNTTDFLPSERPQYEIKRHVPNRQPPPNYTCHRCGKPNHYIQFCPTNGDPKFNIKKPKKPTGIPRDFLKSVVVTGPLRGDNECNKGLLLLPGGQGFAVMQPNEYVKLKAHNLAGFLTYTFTIF